MKIIVAGGTGWLGSVLTASLVADQHEVIILTRRPPVATPEAAERHVSWDGRTLGPWVTEVAGADAIVNLSGAPIAPARWTTARKRTLRASRIESTRTLVAALEATPRRPAVLVSASAIGYYGDRGDENVAENDPPGHDFLAELCRDWEAEATRATALGVRVVLPRLGVVLGPDGGALLPLAMISRFFLGGPIGTGRQWMPWVARTDVVALLRFALTRPEVSGPINVVSPNPVRNEELAREIGKALGRPSWISAPPFMLRLILGEFADTLLTGQRALPTTALKLGFEFTRPTLSGALATTLRPPSP